MFTLLIRLMYSSLNHKFFLILLGHDIYKVVGLDALEKSITFIMISKLRLHMYISEDIVRQRLW